MRLIIIFILVGHLLWGNPVCSDNVVLNENKIKKELKQARNDPNQTAIVEALQSALTFIAESKLSNTKIKEYQKTLDHFSTIVRQLQEQEEEEKEEKDSNFLNNETIDFNTIANSSELNQHLLQVNTQLIELSGQLQQEQDLARAISDSLGLLPQQQTEARKALNEVEYKLQTIPTQTRSTPLEYAKTTELKAEQIARRLKVEELDLAQLSANNRQELSRLRTDLLKKRQDRLEKILQILRNQLNSLRQQETKQAFEHTEIIVRKHGDLPEYISNQLQINRELSIALNKQAQKLDSIATQQRLVASQILQVRQALTTLREQAKWLSESPALGEILRARVARLPEMPKSQQIISDMAQLRVQRLHFEYLMNKLPQFANVKKYIFTPLTREETCILDTQIVTQRNLLNSLITGCDTQILELTKLKVANSQLEETIKEIKRAAHRYLFWVADVSPLSLNFPIQVGQDLRRLLTLNNLNQLTHALGMIFTNQTTILPLLGSLLLSIFIFSFRRHYHIFLESAGKMVGKVHQDHFFLTLSNVFWSVLMAMQIPLLWASLGYGLHHAWPYPIAVALGEGVSKTVTLLWIFLICAYFASTNGLFIAHFGWSPQQIKRALRYYRVFIGMIVSLMTALITLDHYSDREFASTLGRLCFILLCVCLALGTSSLKRSGLPLLYLEKQGESYEKIVNRSLWNMIIFAPIIAAISTCIGYLATAQALLARFETSLAIWFLLIIIYHIIRRWMLIQRRRIAFERTKQRRAEMIAQRARNEEDTTTQEVITEDEKVVNLDTISAQSLKLVRSILTLIALLSVILIWSELHSAFGFLENITLWEVSSSIPSIQGSDSIQPITLGAVLIATLVFIVTTQMVRNLPALLELALLQHLDLTPGTGYAITTLTKYGLMLLGGLIGFSMIGIEWSKLQWLVAALGVGLGFGLQEIFANFISGLIILFEKPIRIGDTVTIRHFTGNITRINTRATTITDWDRKEIIVPNKAFITEQFVNWSLSDTVTRVVLNVPAPAGANVEKVSKILIQAARRCPLVLEIPAPEAYVIDLQQGLPLFELRMHVAEVRHRMPLRHQVHTLILHGYRESGLELPFPPFQLRKGQLLSNNSNNNETV